MSDLKYPPCLRPGCKSPQGHPNCQCFANQSPSQLVAAGYQRPGTTKGMTKRTNPDTGESWYSGPGNGVQWLGSTSSDTAQTAGRSLASKFVKYAKWGLQTAAKIGSTYFAEGGRVSDHDLIGPHHREGCHHYASGGEVDEINEFQENPSLAIDHSIVHHGLLHALTKMGHSKSEDPNKPMEHFRDSARRGKKSVESHSKAIFEKHDDIEPDKNDVTALREHLEKIRENPSLLLDVGGNLDMPAHRAALGAKAATAASYLNSLRPPQQQSSPLDMPMPPDPMAEQHYDRQLGIAQSPLSSLGHAKSGTLQPEDIQTLQTIYPDLVNSLKNKTFESLVDAKSKDQEIPYKTKIGLSHLQGQPLDSTMTLQAMQAIIHANMPGAQPQPSKKSKSGATAQTQKTIDKVDDLYKTPLEAIQIDKRQ